MCVACMLFSAMTLRLLDRALSRCASAVRAQCTQWKADTIWNAKCDSSIVTKNIKLLFEIMNMFDPFLYPDLYFNNNQRLVFHPMTPASL